MIRELLPIYFRLVLMPLVMTGLTYYKYSKYQKAEFKHLSEFFLSMALVMTSSWFLMPLGPAFVVLSMLPWMWTIRTFGLVMEDVSRQTLFSKLHYYVLALGGIVSIIFLSFRLELPLVAAPFSLSIAFIGFTFIFQAYSKRRFKSYGPFQHLNFILVLGFFGSRLIFPLFLTENGVPEAPARIDSYLLIFFCISLYPLYAEIIFEKEEKQLEKVLQTRNRQLLSHSGFSEYKILGAGLSHEVNNALTIINAKVSRLVQNKSRNPTQDLQIVQNATNRIVSSIRSFREFIYPREAVEVLDIGQLINGVLSLYGQRLINHGVRVSVTGLEGKLVKGQQVQLEQVFLSLINNSVDAVDRLEDKWINISGKGNDEVLEIIYKDSGHSNAMEIVPLLRNPFNAFHEFMDNDIRLVQSKEIIEKHGGVFNCVVGTEHSTFSITLPLSEAFLPPSELRPPEEEESESRSLH